MTDVTRPAAFIVCLAVASVFVGCAYDYAPVRVDVRDRATLAPVAGAEVRVSNTRTVNPYPPNAAYAVTDDAGAATLSVAVYNDLIVRVTPPGGFEHVFSVAHPAVAGAGAWTRPVRTAGARVPVIEIRLSPGLAQPPGPTEPDSPGAEHP
ncbi:MAG: hypothetical protein D6693_05205 [Planctomycetota bacterium]|nr:MAG: hypothetical protein D6693_05205 [Planctomycetota bacterium]